MASSFTNSDVFILLILFFGVGFIFVTFIIGIFIGSYQFEKGYCIAINETYFDSDYDTKTFSCVDNWGNVTEFYKTEVGKTYKVFEKGA